MANWNIITSEIYDAWFQEQSFDNQSIILGKVYLLEEHGPILGRPNADTLKWSKKIANLKELRAKTDENIFRIAFVFDPDRKGVLLTGGDKKGKNQKKFYKDLIKEAEQVYEKYLEKKIKEKEKKHGI